jgi:catechol 2,3-dioxygenase-like lactoylglutathione lyase family enzyme
MQITLSTNDIKKALTAYVATLGLDLTSRSVEVVLIAGRGTNGHTAVVKIDEDDEVVSEVEIQCNPPVPKTVITRVPKVEEEVVAEYPTITPETEGHESVEPKSIFD